MLKMETYAYKYIPITLKDGQENRLILVDEDTGTFMFDYVLKQDYSYDTLYNENEQNVLDRKIMHLIPDKIRQIMLPFSNDNYFRLPTEREIFGDNNYSTINESSAVKRFEYTKDIKHRIGIHKIEGVVSYWLANICRPYCSCNIGNDAAIIVNDDGYGSWEYTDYTLYIRPLIKLRY